MSINKISIYIERNTKIEYRKYTIYKATLYLKTIQVKLTETYDKVPFFLLNEILKTSSQNLLLLHAVCSFLSKPTVIISLFAVI